MPVVASAKYHRRMPLEPSFLGTERLAEDDAAYNAQRAAAGLAASCRSFGHRGVVNVVPAWEPDMGGWILLGQVTRQTFQKPRELSGLPPVFLGYPVVVHLSRKKTGRAGEME